MPRVLMATLGPILKEGGSVSMDRLGAICALILGAMLLVALFDALGGGGSSTEQAPGPTPALAEPAEGSPRNAPPAY